MFEGVVNQVISGFLGRYFRDIQRHQLKFTLWEGALFLENLELSLEAFDYLQLPFALKQGRVGKLSIKIPWKKLGWDPIEIVLENVFLSAAQRDDQEWSLDEVERRELAGKKAKLAAAELAKLSKRVCENQAGLISYISAKALDSIQVSIKDFHILYHDKLSDSAYTVFGLKLSSLRTMKQNPFGSSGGKGGQDNKFVDITGLEFYCGTFHGAMELMTMNNGGDSELWHDTRSDRERYDSILSPCDVSLSLSVNRSGQLDNNNPQYSINAEITGLVMSLNEVQLQQILILWDYLCTSELRNKYWRYRPWCSLLSKKMKGWQILWWRYAQESILSDVRKRLRKSSWRYFGQRLSSCRKYVNLYKTKLDFLRHYQPIDESTQWELEQMEKELDIDDILSYRSTAECELQEFLSNSSTSHTIENVASISVERIPNDERSAGKSRGWLNWLSRGMLGAGGTDDSGQFSGVVSDEVIKDIYEATEFNPPVLSNQDALTDKISICALQFSIHQISATLRNMKYGQEIAELMLNGVIVECKFWEESATIVTTVNSGQMVYPCSKKVILHMRRPIIEKKLLDNEHPSCKLQVDVSPNLEVEMSIKGMLQPLEVTIDAEFFLNLIDFFGVLKSFEGQHGRVLLSLNGIENVNGRLLSKAEYLLSHLRKVLWDVSIFNIIINVPWRDAISEQHNLVFEAGSLMFRTKCDMGSNPSDNEQAYALNNLLTSVSECKVPLSFQLQDLYDHFEVKLNDFEMKITMPSHTFPISILEKLSASISLARCLIQDESVLKQLEVYINVSSLNAHFSPSLYAAILGLIAYLVALQSSSESVSLETIDSFNVASKGSRSPVFGFSTNVKLETVSCRVELENEKENSSSIMLVFQQLNISYALTELEKFWISMEALRITTSHLTGESNSPILHSNGNQSSTSALHQHGIGLSNRSDDFAKNIVNTEACFILQYESLRKESVHKKCRISLNNADVHCYPNVIRLLIAFFDKLSTYGASDHGKLPSSSTVDAGNPEKVNGFGFQRFGFSNFIETGSSEHASIPLDHFPFVTICNSGSLGSLESSLLYASHEWREYFCLREGRMCCPQSNTKKVSENFQATPLESTSVVEASDVDGSSADTSSLFVIDITLCEIRVHFHDSSCIVGTITLPTSKSSVLISENCFDILCSTEGLVLTSSWYPQNLRQFLWGPSLPSLSPILNVRVSKEKCGPLSSRIEVSVGVQHVYCILPPEYLAVLIGYFSLPDWSSDSNEQPVIVGCEYIETGNECSLVYKIEILDSTLILPMKSNEGHFLKTELQQLYCSFIDSSSLNNVLKDIPPECWVPAHKLSERNHCLNLFGRDLFLSFLSLKDDGRSHLKFDQDIEHVDIPLVAPLCADVWVKIPCENESSSSPSTICVMTRIKNCQLMAEDAQFFHGFEGLLDAINQFSEVSDVSKCFKSDVPQFLQLKRTLEQNNAVSPVISSITFTEVRCYCDSLSMQLNRFGKGLKEPIAKAEMQFMCSASLRNDDLLSVVLSFSSLALYSLPDSVLLARFKSMCSTSAVLDFSLSKETHGEMELLVSLPSVDVWLYLSYWTDVIDCLKSYPGQLSISEPDNLKQDADVLFVKSENICVTCHFPVWIGDDGWEECQVDEGHGEGHPNYSSNRKNFRCLAVTLCSKSSELFVDGRNVKVKSNMEKLSGMVLLSEEESGQSWPLFQICQVFLEAQINNNQMELAHVEVDVQCDHLDVWISHRILYFWHGIPFNVGEGGPSQFSYGGIDFKVQLRKISFLLSDGRWSCSGPLFQILMGNIFLHANMTQNNLKGSVNGDLQVNYNNIHKVFWEPFIEPWKFEVDVIRKQEMSLNSSILTDINIKSTAHLNLNFTESLIEVLLSNATSMPLDLRFDIPFGVSPMILDPIYPGQELPLPLHLAEAGRIRWRPIGDSYLWSEVYNLSNLLSQESKIGFLKSFVCYPAHPNSDPFRCCISVRNISLPSSVRSRKTFSPHLKSTLKQSVVDGQISQKLEESKKQFVHQVTLSIPLVVNNYLPKEVTLTIESGGITRTAFLSEVETSFHNVDPSHHLKLEILLHGFKPAVLNFPRNETFCKMAKFAGAKFSLSEIVAFYTDSSNGPIYVTVEKVLDAFSGARELFIFVPFLLYNCTGFPLFISEASSEMKGVSCSVPSCYDMAEQELLQGKKDGLSLVSSSHHLHATDSHGLGSSLSRSHIVSVRENANPHKEIFLSKPLNPLNSQENFQELSSKSDLDHQNSLFNSSQNQLSSSCQLTLKDSNFYGYERGRARACMFSANPVSSVGEVTVRASRCLPEYLTENMPNSLWSSPFSLVPPSGSTTVLVPQPSSNAAFMLSVTSSAVAAPFAGRTSAITFQPRYIISNACSKDVCYKQKGTDFVFHLGIGEHSHLHWMDTAMELLVSIRYDEPGWQWSGGFLPDHLGDTQVKMRNYLSGSLNMIRVEVQNADVSMGDEKIVGNFHGNSGTNLILISDDETGYMPYRIDNFSNERLRIYQQRCETVETTVHSYTSCPYAWDEPCYPHRLTVEVPGKRVLGSYTLDDVKEYSPVQLPSSSEKPERTLHLSIHAEGATKVLHVIDSSYHILNDMKKTSVPRLREKRNDEQKQDKCIGFMERISVVIQHIGISMINIHPQELLFACAKNITIDLVQSLDQQKLSFQMTSLQIDNQLRSSPYPVILSFDRDYKSNPIGHVNKDDVTKQRSERKLQRTSHSSFEPVFYLAVSKWRKKDVSLVSFEYISLRVADFCLELEQELILSLFGFIKNVSSRFQSRVLPLSDPFLGSHIKDTGLMDSYATVNQLHLMPVPVFNESHKPRLSLPSIVPIGAPWQQIYLLARRQKKIYVEVFDLCPINLTLSFSSAPWMRKNGILTAGESVIHRGLMALADVEGARIHLKQLTIAHQIASLESLQEILVRHYTRQLLHEMYKVFGSAGVIGNPMGFARSMGLGIKDFLSVPARSIFLSPTGLITGMAQGTTSLLSNTVYAISDAATQFSKAAHKGIVAFTFDDQAVSGVEQQQIGVATHSKGVINGVFEGLTGLLQSPIKGAERHGLPGVLSGIALGITGLVAKPAASILEVTGKTAQSIRNRSRFYQMGQQRFRVRLPRPLSRELPLRPYTWEEAVGASALVEADDSFRLKDEILVMCKELRQAGKFVIITHRLVLIVSCSSLVDLGKPEFRGVPADLEWVIESEVRLESVIHADCDQGVVHIVGSSSNIPLRQNQQAKRSSGTGAGRWNNPTVPLIQTNLELAHQEDAENLLQILLSTIELGKEQGWGCRYLLHRSNIK
ncbi:PREDICTED: vacuolar [Prunus dulcis]|uniref:PREDICTED: vacuolar n=1 Tax=Prunus dulcis TaxID=3755 RepID=A0A5E4FWM4_PRUDU|nr:PREDICTED: vacuolar [Prunus dulcis]